MNPKRGPGRSSGITDEERTEILRYVIPELDRQISRGRAHMPTKAALTRRNLDKGGRSKVDPHGDEQKHFGNKIQAAFGAQAKDIMAYWHYVAAKRGRSFI